MAEHYPGTARAPTTEGKWQGLSARERKGTRQGPPYTDRSAWATGQVHLIYSVHRQPPPKGGET